MIEPFFGGSHRAFAEGLQSHSCHDIDFITLPDRNWDWRMRGSALYIAKKIEKLFQKGFAYDGLITSNMVRIGDLKALLGDSLPPVLVYFHESQLTYPIPRGEKRDKGLVMNDITTALVADRILFNSAYHLSEFMTSLASWLAHAPDYPVPWIYDDIKAKSSVLYPGVELFSEEALRFWNRDKPLIVWNHRWSYDKNAPSFFFALDQMVKQGLDFDVALIGECPGWTPKEFIAAKERLGEKLIQFGYLDCRDDYVSLLKSGSIIVSTAKQENFGMSVVEAVHYGCLPLLPDRLSYPELMPEKTHGLVLYSNQKDFLTKLEHFIRNWKDHSDLRLTLSSHMKRFSWHGIIGQYDSMLTDLFAPVDINVR